MNPQSHCQHRRSCPAAKHLASAWGGAPMVYKDQWQPQQLRSTGCQTGPTLPEPLAALHAEHAASSHRNSSLNWPPDCALRQAAANIVASQPSGQSWDMINIPGSQAISKMAVCTADEHNTKA
eukprot:CAMPEP_0204483892 /NCGR_PEP_ID=MMETSP0471-20130131/55893_1 /ASSEMBLY_ACC=CAM_ASM_000602 /TAXON_ID=2969 /ORGANISM="Oxyrrhis marina" /LENGTH=122 /DNA_ID=CAMNT_0051487265 /DNA_START=11 /DNA_END=378 /DNA_ORIENTATION=+